MNLETLLHDIRFGTRLLWKDKGFTATAVLTLALCIAANTALFTVVNAVLLRPLPFPDADRIVLTANSYPKAGAERASSSVPDYYDRLKAMTALEEQALYTTRNQSVGESGKPERVLGMQVTPSFFRLLRIPPRLGRTFTDDEGEIGQEQKVVLSFAFWQQLFGGDEHVIGRELRINSAPFTIVGVMPREFSFLDPDVRLWTPLVFTAEQKSDDGRHNNSWNNIGRLKPGATIEQAQAQVNALNASNLERFPKLKTVLINAGFHTNVVRLQDDVVRDVKGTLYLFWGGAFFVLLIGCVNVANLALVRSSVRLKELATRVALGAGRWRVTRQLLTESVILTLVSGALGLLLGSQLLRLLQSVNLQQIPRGAEIALDGTVAAFTLGLAAILGLVIGVIPVANVLHANLSAVFREDSRTGSGGRGTRALRRGLVVAQVAVAFTLLIGAGLLLASFRHVLSVDPGFDSRQVLTASMSLPSTRYKGDDELRAFTTAALERIRALPGVTRAGATSTIPFGGNYSDSVILAEGYVMSPGESLISPSQVVVTPGYFETMGIRLIRGRFFDERDIKAAQHVAIVDERLARKFWPNADPIGRRMHMPGDSADIMETNEKTDWLTVVGVVAEVKIRGLVDDHTKVGAYYFPYGQSTARNVTFALKAAGDPTSLIGAVRAEMAGRDPDLPLYNVQTMEERTEKSLVNRKSPVMLAIGFAAVALLLSAVGIYGVLAYLVAQRRKEIGIRIALGSSQRRIFELVLREGVLLIGIGFGLGALGVLALRSSLESQLYGVQPTDPAVVLLVTAVLGAVALAACVVPASRATRIDPIVALTQE